MKLDVQTNVRLFTKRKTIKRHQSKPTKNLKPKIRRAHVLNVLLKFQHYDEF